MSTSTTTISIGHEHGWAGSRRLFSLTPEDLLHHCYVLGQTGAGKSTTISNIAVQLIAGGEGFALLDPHGTEAKALLDQIPSHRTRDVVYFNPQDRSWPIGINLLEEVDPDAQHLVAANIVDALKHLHSDSWGPRMDWILYCSLRAIVEGGGTIMDVGRLLTDSRYRHAVVRKVRDSAVREFWIEEFGNYTKRFRVEAISPIQNKLGRLRADPVLRNILGQKNSTIDVRFMMDDRRILIANLGYHPESCNFIR